MESATQRKPMRTLLKILCHAAAITAIYLWFSFSLFLDLQVRPLYGNLGMLVTLLLVAAYLYFGFVRKRKMRDSAAIRAKKAPPPTR